MVSSINHSLPGTLHSLHSSYLSHPHAKLNSPSIPPLHFCHWMFWRNTVVWLQTRPWKWSQTWSCRHFCCTPLPSHFPLSSTRFHHFLNTQPPPTSSPLADDLACFTGNGRNQTRMSTNSYPHIHPLTRQHLQAHALLPARGVELPAAESYILPDLCSRSHDPPLPTQTHPTHTSSFPPRPFLSASKYVDIFPI